MINKISNGKQLIVNTIEKILTRQNMYISFENKESFQK